MKGDPKGDVRRMGTTGASKPRDNRRASDDSTSDAQAKPRPTNEAFRETLIRLMLRDDGYLRAIPDGDGEKVFLKWKFTAGQFAGQYVMAVVLPYEIEHGYVLLLTKVIGSYAGLYTPSTDRRYTDE